MAWFKVAFPKPESCRPEKSHASLAQRQISMCNNQKSSWFPIYVAGVMVWGRSEVLPFKSFNMPWICLHKDKIKVSKIDVLRYHTGPAYCLTSTSDHFETVASFVRDCGRDLSYLDHCRQSARHIQALRLHASLLCSMTGMLQCSMIYYVWLCIRFQTFTTTVENHQNWHVLSQEQQKLCKPSPMISPIWQEYWNMNIGYSAEEAWSTQ